jgi:uncharacterized coiled-coil protein SlyX
MEDDFFKGLRDPYDRLEELEIIVTGQSMAMEQMSEQIKNHAENFVGLSDGIVQITKVIRNLQLQTQSLNQQFQNLHHRVTILEKEKHND